MAQRRDGRLLVERAIDSKDAPKSRSRRPRAARSVTVNLAESPLGWLLSRRLVNDRQFDAGERLRADWERGQFAPRITMSWDAAPVSGRRGGSGGVVDLSGTQIDRKAAFPRGDRRCRARFGRHPMASRLFRRGHARGGDRPRMAGASGQVGAHARARPRRGLLPRRLSAIDAPRGPSVRSCGHANPFRSYVPGTCPS